MDPDKIKGDIQRPYNAPEEKSSGKVDPEKFKKVMKVEETDETEKRKKRNLPKKEEEDEGGDEEVQEQAAPPNPDASFSELMSDKEKLDNVFDKQSRGTRRQVASEENAPFTDSPLESSSTEEAKLNSETKPPIANSSNSSKTSSRADQNQQPKTPSSPPPTSFQNEQERSTKQEPPKGDEKQEEQIEKQDPSLLASQPKTKDLNALKKKGPKEIAPEVKIVPGKKPLEKKEKPMKQNVLDKAPQKFKERGAPSSQEKKQPPTSKSNENSINVGGMEKPTAKKAPFGEKPSKETLKKDPFSETKEEDPTKELAKKPSPFKRFSTEEARSQKMGKEEQKVESEELFTPLYSDKDQEEMGGRKKKKDESSFLEADSQTAGIPLPTFENPLPAIVPSPNAPAYSKLSPEVHELFEKMGGVMTIQQDKGITTTTMSISMPGSVFDGAQVILNQYSTAPNSFNIQLVGNPDSVRLFNQNLAALKASFKEANFNFETNILKPILTTSKKSPHLIRRAKSGGGKGGRGKK